MNSAATIYLVACLSLVGMVVRPWRTTEVAWAVAGGVSLVLFGLLPVSDSLAAVAQGRDVYLFLLGMMLLSASAEREGVFDYLATICAAQARGSPRRLFALIYAIGTVVTTFMSNDATAVVLTPAVLAVCRRARVKPLPYLLACALIANAASFVLPISNPANLVVFGARLPSLQAWIGRFLLPSLLSIVTTYLVLRWLCRNDLDDRAVNDLDAGETFVAPSLSRSGRLAARGIVLTALALLVASSNGVDLGLPTLVAALTASSAIWVSKRESPLVVLRLLSWSVVPLVAGLFVIVAGLQRAGLLDALVSQVQSASSIAPTGAAIGAGVMAAFACNLMNNLPAGLIAGGITTASGAGPLLQSALAIGIDVGPNLSVTGSLATILCLVAIRQRGEHVSAWTFLKVGAVVMPLALAAALAGLWLQTSVFG